MQEFAGLPHGVKGPPPNRGSGGGENRERKSLSDPRDLVPQVPVVNPECSPPAGHNMHFVHDKQSQGFRVKDVFHLGGKKHLRGKVQQENVFLSDLLQHLFPLLERLVPVQKRCSRKRDVPNLVRHQGLYGGYNDGSFLFDVEQVLGRELENQRFTRTGSGDEEKVPGFLFGRLLEKVLDQLFLPHVVCLPGMADGLEPPERFETKILEQLPPKCRNLQVSTRDETRKAKDLAFSRRTARIQYETVQFLLSSPVSGVKSNQDPRIPRGELCAKGDPLFLEQAFPGGRYLEIPNCLVPELAPQRPQVQDLFHLHVRNQGNHLEPLENRGVKSPHFPTFLEQLGEVFHQVLTPLGPKFGQIASPGFDQHTGFSRVQESRGKVLQQGVKKRTHHDLFLLGKPGKELETCGNLFARIQQSVDPAVATHPFGSKPTLLHFSLCKQGPRGKIPRSTKNNDFLSLLQRFHTFLLEKFHSFFQNDSLLV